MNDAVKTCPMCAEQVKAAAVRCRFCGYSFVGGPAEPYVPSSAERAVDMLSGGTIKIGVAALLILGLLAFCSSLGDSSSAVKMVAPVPEPSLTQGQRAECATALANASKAGVIRKIEPNIHRITVDERAWREIGPDNRVGVMAFAACDWFGVRFAELGEGQLVTVAGWQSGERLASSMGGAYAGN